MVPGESIMIGKKHFLTLGLIAACGGTQVVEKPDGNLPDASDADLDAVIADDGTTDSGGDAGDSSTGADVVAQDGANDGGKDTGIKDAAKDGSAVCPDPEDLTGWMPGQATPPRAPDLTACQSNDYQAYYNACFGNGATAQTCQTWTQGHQACAACIVSSENDAQWGLTVEGSGVVSINIAGCLKLVGETACSTAYANVQMCTAAGCEAQCPVTDSQSFALYQQCVTKVSAGACKTYVDAQNLVCSPDAANVNKCTSGGGFQALLVKLGPVFCGP
jgi:hypothetical protein